MEQYCHRIKGVMISTDFRVGFTTLVRVACKQWCCTSCGPKNALQWRSYLLKKFNKDFGHERWCFVTITAHAKAHVTSKMTILNLQQVWKKLYDRMRRRWGKEQAQYVRVFEQHKSGRFHMHFLINCGDAYDAAGIMASSIKREFRHPECIWLKNACVACGGGWRVHMRRVWEADTRTANVGLVVGYLLKYMGKSMSVFEFPKHQRRVATSRGIGSPNTDKDRLVAGHWEHRREISLAYVAVSEKKIVDMTTGEILDASSFCGEGHYPPLEFYRGE